MTLAVLKCLTSRLESDEIDYKPVLLISTSKANSSMLFEIFCSKN